MHDSVRTAVRQIGGNRVAGRWAFSPAAFGLLIIVRDYAFSGSLKSDHEDRVILLANAYHRSATLSFALFIFTAHSVPRGFPKFLCPEYCSGIAGFFGEEYYGDLARTVLCNFVRISVSLSLTSVEYVGL